jgi:hypothetical protein
MHTHIRPDWFHRFIGANCRPGALNQMRRTFTFLPFTLPADSFFTA